jgi:hypothetical protein
MTFGSVILEFSKICYNLLNNAFFNHPKTMSDKIPYVTIILFILAVILKTIQKIKNNTNYLQQKIRNSRYKTLNPISAFFINYLNAMGINSFFTNNVNTIWTGILLLILTYPLLALIELNIGHRLVAYFIIVLIFYNEFAGGFQELICYNDFTNSSLNDSPFCCGSFFAMAILGCTFAILFSYGQGWIMKSILGGIALFLWVILVLVDYYTTFSNDKDDKRKCKAFYWHACNYFFGFISGLLLVC